MLRTRYNGKNSEGTGVQYNPVRPEDLAPPDYILPKHVDANSWEGQCVTAYALDIASEIPDSGNRIVRSRIVTCACLLVMAEKLAHQFIERKPVKPRDLSSVAYAADMALSRLYRGGAKGGQPMQRTKGNGNAPRPVRGRKESPFLH